MPISDVHGEELNQLKEIVNERRAGAAKGAWPSDVRERIVRLWRSGVPMRDLSEQLGIAASMLYAWGKQKSDEASSHESPAQVLQVDPGRGAAALGSAAAGELRLQMGMFTVTVTLAGT